MKIRQIVLLMCCVSMWLLVPGLALAQISDDEIARAFVKPYDFVCLIRVKDFKAEEVEVIAVKGQLPPKEYPGVRLAVCRLLKEEGKSVLWDKDEEEKIDKQADIEVERGRVIDAKALVIYGWEMQIVNSIRFGIRTVRKEGWLEGDNQVKMDALLRMGANGKVVYRLNKGQRK